MPNKESMLEIERAELIVSVDTARDVDDPFKLPASLRTIVETRLADLKAKDGATLIRESGRAESAFHVRTSLDKLQALLIDGYNYIKGIGGYTINEGQRLGVFTAYGWESGLIGRLTDDRIEALANQAPLATAAISNPEWRYPPALLTLIATELATLNANQPLAQTGDRQAMIAARDEALKLLRSANDRVRFQYCASSDDEDGTPELAKIGRQPRRPPGTSGGLGTPSGLELTANTDLTVSVQWNELEEADHYLLLVQRMGIDDDYVQEPTTFTDSAAILGPFASGLTIRVKVRAVKENNQGPLSAAAEVVLPSSNVPATPGAPTLTALNDGQVLVEWGPVAGATYFIVQRMVLGQETEYVNVGNVIASNPSTTLTSLPPGETVRVRLIAVNATGQSPPGPYAEVETIA